jgi:Carboxypeptidase regulatory-like domain
LNQSVSGCVVDETTGEPLTSPDVRLYRIGVPGETVTVLDEYGCFSFADLSAGDYSLAFYDSKYAPRYERLTLAEDEPLDALLIALKPGGFLSGRILDEKHMPPWRCWFTLIRAGERGGKSGYISDSGDHRITADGTFLSPPLGPDLYFLRFAGILHEPPPAQPPEPPHLVMRKRLFDFLYPEAQDVSDATGFHVQAGQTISGLQIQIPRPVWYTVRGKVTGDLPIERTRINVMFSRTMGTIDGVGGGAGALVEPDGTFESQVQSGVYSLDVCEFSPPEPGGRTRMLRKLATANIQVTNADLYGVEIQIPSGTAG